MDILARLHAAVKACGWSKKQVADRAKMTPYQLSRLLNGRLKRPSLPAVEAVLTAIGQGMEDLYGDTPSNDVRHALRVLTEYVDTERVVSIAGLCARRRRVSPGSEKAKLKSRREPQCDLVGFRRNETQEGSE